MERSYDTAIVWLRRDLRVRDNVALARAARASGRVCVAFNLDPELLGSERIGAPIVQAFFGALGALRIELRERGSDLALLQGDFATELTALARRIGADAVYFNEDYDPRARTRDARVAAALRSRGLAVHSCQDHVYFGADEVLTDAGAPYKVYGPYKRRWLDQRQLAPRKPVDSLSAARSRFIGAQSIALSRDIPRPEEFGYASRDAYPQVSEPTARTRLDAFIAGRLATYATVRDRPDLDATSHLSADLRAGTIGIRTCVEAAFAFAAGAQANARTGAETWIGELIWRDFYQMLLRRFPHVDGAPFLPAANGIVWTGDREAFERWTRGQTGYPIVDAAMRQLNTTGWMHNRLRMITASFLTKDLLIDWRWGERYFETHLADADLAQNNGGWQWAASTGADAAPYFRVFNPVLQSKKFDPEGAFIRRYVRELDSVPAAYVHEPWTMPPLIASACRFRIGADYPAPIVEHAQSRQRAIAAYSAALGTRPGAAGAGRDA